jgi:Single-strand binding protein family
VLLYELCLLVLRLCVLALYSSLCYTLLLDFLSNRVNLAVFTPASIPFSSFWSAQHRGKAPRSWRIALSSSQSPPGSVSIQHCRRKRLLNTTNNCRPDPREKLSRWRGERTPLAFRVPDKKARKGESQIYKNSANLIGLLGKDAEVKAAQDKTTNFTVLSLATEESWKNKQANEWESRTEWHRILVFGRLGHFAAMLTKGAHIEVEGRLCSREQIFELKGTPRCKSLKAELLNCEGKVLAKPLFGGSIPPCASNNFVVRELYFSAVATTGTGSYISSRQYATISYCPCQCRHLKNIRTKKTL